MFKQTAFSAKWYTQLNSSLKNANLHNNYISSNFHLRVHFRISTLRLVYTPVNMDDCRFEKKNVSNISSKKLDFKPNFIKIGDWHFSVPFYVFFIFGVVSSLTIYILYVVSILKLVTISRRIIVEFSLLPLFLNLISIFIYFPIRDAAFTILLSSELWRPFLSYFLLHQQIFQIPIPIFPIPSACKCQSNLTLIPLPLMRG